MGTSEIVEIIPAPHVGRDDPPLTPVGAEHALQLARVVEMANQAAKIAVARHDDRPLIVWIFDHCLEYQLGVYVALGLAIAAISDGLEDHGVARLLEPRVKRLVIGDESNEGEGAGHTVVFLETHAEAAPIYTPTEVP